MAGKYNDLIDLPRPASRHPAMSMADRAAQFGSFAALSGFDCASYFHRKFKSEVGCTPNEFRRQSALEPSADISGTHP